MSPFTLVFFMIGLAASQEIQDGVTRKAEVDTVVDPGVEKKVSRSQEDGAITVLTMELLHQISHDPIALTCGALMFAYMVGQMLIPSVEKKDTEAQRIERKGSVSSSTNEHSFVNKEKRRQRNNKSSFAISINQRLMALNTPDEVLDYALFHEGRTDIVNIVTALHRSAKLAAGGQRRYLGQDARVVTLTESLQKFMENETLPVHVLSRAVGNTSWALAKMQFKGVGEDAVLSTLQEKFTEHAASFKPEELMNTVWAFAELRHDTKEGQLRALEVAKAAVSCLGRFPDFTLQQVVYLAWALARLAGSGAVRNSEEVTTGLLGFIDAITKRIRPEVASLTTKNLAMICWGIAQLCVQLKIEDKAEVSALVKDVASNAASREMRSFVPGELASVVWALNKCHVEHPVFFKAFRAHITKTGLKGYNSQDLANILCAYVNMGAGDDEFIVLLGSAVEQNAASFNRLEKMMVHWAFSQRSHLTAPKLDNERTM